MTSKGAFPLSDDFVLFIPTGSNDVFDRKKKKEFWNKILNRKNVIQKQIFNVNILVCLITNKQVVAGGEAQKCAATWCVPHKFRLSRTHCYCRSIVHLYSIRCSARRLTITFTTGKRTRTIIVLLFLYTFTNVPLTIDDTRIRTRSRTI